LDLNSAKAFRRLLLVSSESKVETGSEGNVLLDLEAMLCLLPDEDGQEFVGWWLKRILVRKTTDVEVRG